MQDELRGDHQFDLQECWHDPAIHDSQNCQMHCQRDPLGDQLDILRGVLRLRWSCLFLQITWHSLPTASSPQATGDSGSRPSSALLSQSLLHLLQLALRPSCSLAQPRAFLLAVDPSLWGNVAWSWFPLSVSFAVCLEWFACKQISCDHEETIWLIVGHVDDTDVSTCLSFPQSMS